MSKAARLVLLIIFFFPVFVDEQGKAAALISKLGGSPHDYGISQVETQLTYLIDDPSVTLKHYLYKVKPYIYQRWSVTMALVLIDFWRTYYNPAVYIALAMVGGVAIILLGFVLTPAELTVEMLFSKDNPSEELPISCSEEFKPFAPKLPEIHYW